jgi:DNA-binding transcriptional LysR family regulator
MNLDIDALRAFVAVADERSFTRAAQAVSRTQSTVSVQIKNLEGRLGFALFERTQRSVALTVRGHTLLNYARSILQLNDDSVRALTAPQTEGRLRLGITEYFAPQHLPQLLAHFREHHPLLALEVTTGVTGTLRSLQKTGELDLVLGRRDLAGSGSTRDRATPAARAPALGGCTWPQAQQQAAAAAGAAAGGLRRARPGYSSSAQTPARLAKRVLRA